jgi:hypothetical protein
VRSVSHRRTAGSISLFWLKSGATHPRVRKVDDYGSLGRVLHFRLEREEDLDPALARLLAEAYAVAAQREITPSRGRRAPVQRGDS